MKKKKLFSVLLAFVLLLSIVQVTATATTDNMNFEEMDYSRLDSIIDNAQNFLNSTGYNNTLDASVPMYNLNEEIEAVYFPLQPTGYLIASYKNGRVLEFSPDTQRFTDTSGKLYYNGIMEYYKAVDNTKLDQVLSNDLVDREELKSIFDQTCLEYIPLYDYQPSTSTYGLEPNNPTPAEYVKWSDSYYCTITAITNLLEYYHDFMNADVYAENVDTITSLRRFLKRGGPDAGYVYSTGPLYFNTACRRHNFDGNIYSGLQAYFNRNDVDTYTTNVLTEGQATVSIAKTQLNAYRRPVLLGINSDSLRSSRSGLHAILAYTYMETADTTYFIVNDGWGGNHTYLCADAITWLNILYLT